MKLSDVQRKVYESDENLLVTAGAGSGKTRVLVEKFVSVFEDYHRSGNPLKIDQVVAITFTEKAAREMRERVTGHLTEKISSGKVHPYRELKRELPFARISTIHSFCSRIIRESALYTGIDPDFKVASGLSASRRIAKLVDAYMIENLQEVRKFFSSDSKLTFEDLRKWFYDAIANRWMSGYVPEGMEDGVLLELYRTHAERLVAEYRELSKEEAVVDFEDLLLMTRDLLSEKEELRQRYSDYFVHIFVDEFQDTNTLQSEIIDLLRSKSNRIWYIGDPKQSIYAFRGADVGVFLGVEQNSEDLGVKVRELAENYRSHPNLVEFYNRFFPGVFKDSEITYSEQIKGNSEGDGKHVVLLENGGEGNAPEFREAEAKAIARFILKMNAEGREFADVAVLLRKMSNVDFIEREFVNLGIPYHVIGGKNFFQKDEVMTLQNMISAVVDPYDDRAMTGVLMSSFFDLSLDEILSLRGKEARLYDAVKKEEKYAWISGLMEELASLKNTVDVSKLLEIGIRRTDYLGKVAQHRDGDKRVANVMKFLETINGLDVPAWDLNSIRRLIEWGGDENEEEASALSESENVVKIMTVHKSKGLEFPVVILGQIGGRGRNGGERTESEMEEERRLLYVGMTRAKDLLVISKEKMTSKNVWANALRESSFVDGEEKWIVPDGMEDLAEVVSGGELAERTVEIGMKPFDLVEEYLERIDTGFRHSFFNVTDLSSEDGTEEEMDSRTAAAGSIAHKILERVDEKVSLEDSLSGKLFTVFPTDLVDGVKKTLSALTGTPLISRIEGSERVKSEIGLELDLPELGIKIMGKLDKAVEKDGEWEIMDFKYSGGAAGKRMEDYEFQLRLYMIAFEAMTGARPKGTLFFLKSGREKAVEFVPRSVMLGGISERMKKFEETRERT